MLSKLSVKKPYTVAVFVALVLILGIRSLMMMKTDLLPEMGLPYAFIITTCQGYNPDTVETVVTRPVEQSMATVSNIKEIRSNSGENTSLVFLTFASDTDMDSVSLEIREKLDQISGYWDDNVGKPMIMKINPDMLPIMVTDVEVDNMDISELTEYVESKISPEIESVAGVARVSVAGTVTESVNVTIREDRLKAVNELVKEAIREQFEDKTQALDDAEEELESGQELLDEGKEQLEDGEQMLSDGKQQLANGISEGQKKLSDAQAMIDSGTDTIDKQLQTLEDKQTELTKSKTQLTQTKTALNTLLDETKKARDNLQKLIDLRNSLKVEEETVKSKLDAAIQTLAALVAQGGDGSAAGTSSLTDGSITNDDEIVVDTSVPEDASLTSEPAVDEEDLIVEASVPDVPAADTSVEDVPAADTSVADVPAVDTSVADVPAADTSVPEVPAVDVTVPEVTAVDVTVPEVPSVEASVSEAPALTAEPELGEDDIIIDDSVSEESAQTAEPVVNEEELILSASGEADQMPALDDGEFIVDTSVQDAASAEEPAINGDDVILSASGKADGMPEEDVITSPDGISVTDGMPVTDGTITDGIPVQNDDDVTVSVPEDNSVIPTTNEGESDQVQTDSPDLGQDGDVDVQPASIDLLKQQISALQDSYDQMKANREAAQAQIRVYLETLGLSSTDENSVLTTLDQQISTMETSLTTLSTQEQALDTAQKQLDKGKKKLEKAKKKVQDGQSQVTSGQSQLTTQQILGTIEISVKEANLATAQAQMTEKEASLSTAREQLDAQREQLDDVLQTALDAGNLENLVTRELIAGILAGENFSMPAGYLTEGKSTWLVRVGDKVTDNDQLGDLIILDLGLDGLDPIRLKDVADVTTTDNTGEVYSKLNGKPAVQLTIEKQTGYSTGEVTDQLKKRLKEISAENEQIHFSIMMDQGIYIKLVVDSVISNMLAGAVLAILILLIFLRDIRSTFIIACSIPFSVVASFVLMYFSGITLNVISLSGLALGIGMLVDNSIVVIENTDRLRKEGVPPRLAAVRGASEVSGAIVASTLTTVCVFAPIVFAEGITRELFVDMGLTIAFSLGASLIVALTLVPAMSASLIRKRKKQRPDRIMEVVKNFYGKLLRVVLRIKWLVLLVVVGLLVLSAYLEYQNGTAFLPKMDSTQATMTVTAPKGSSFEDLTLLTDEVVERIMDIPDIDSIGASAGSNGGLGGILNVGETDSSTIYLVLKEDGREMNSVQLQAELEKRTEDLDAEIEITMQAMDTSALGGSGIQLNILGRDSDTLTKLADEATAIIETIPGVINVDSGQDDRSSEFRISVNKAKAMKYNLTVAQVFQAVNERLAEARAATTLSGEAKDYDVFVQDDRDTTLTRELLEDMYLTYTDSENKVKKVRLSRIAEFSEAVSPQVIERIDQTRYIPVTAEVDQDHNIGLVGNEINRRLDEELKMPSGYRYEMKGEDANIQQAMGQLQQMLLLAICLIYLIMVAQFQSIRSPFIIMFTLPLAFTGGLFGLVLADMELSVIAVIGFVILAGIIVNNGIVLVDYTNQLRAQGMSKKDALVRAGMDRLRPIIMTALTTILGLSISAVGVGMGADMIQPMAVVMIGGLIYGTLLTLLVVPCLYDLMNGEKYKTYELEEDDTEPKTEV